MQRELMYLEDELGEITRDQFLQDILSLKEQGEILQVIETDSDQYYVSDANDFKQGLCQLFALALHDIFGYNTFLFKNGSSSHYFCKAAFETEILYIDVRGIISDFQRFISFLVLDDRERKDTSTEYDIDQERPSINQLADIMAYSFAKWIIEKRKNLYDVDYYLQAHKADK